MTKKKDPKNANEMSARELLEAVFPKHVVDRIEEEIEPLRNPATERDSDDRSPDNQSL